jgi:hypothetical protein
MKMSLFFLFMNHDSILSKRNFKFILCIGGLKLLFSYKWTLHSWWGERKYEIRRRICSCKVGGLPMKYIGIPIVQNWVEINLAWMCCINEEQSWGCSQWKILALEGIMVFVLEVAFNFRILPWRLGVVWMASSIPGYRAREDATVLFRKVAVVGMADSPETFRKLGIKHVF